MVFFFSEASPTVQRYFIAQISGKILLSNKLGLERGGKGGLWSSQILILRIFLSINFDIFEKTTISSVNFFIMVLLFETLFCVAVGGSVHMSTVPVRCWVS